MEKIDRAWLDARQACPDGIDDFERVFGGEAAITRANAVAAAEAGLDLDWLAYELLDEDAYLRYADAEQAARMAYTDETSIARDAHRDASRRAGVVLGTARTAAIARRHSALDAAHADETVLAGAEAEAVDDAWRRYNADSSASAANYNAAVSAALAALAVVIEPAERAMQRACAHALADLLGLP